MGDVNTRESSAKTPKKLELGCGRKKPESFYGVDIIETDCVDLKQDLNEVSWDLPSNHFSRIRAIDLFEHIDDPLNFLENIDEIAEDEAKITIVAPHLSSNNWTDPTHKRLYGFRTIQYYFTEQGTYSYYSDANFHIEKSKIEFSKRKLFPWNYIIEPIVNLTYMTKLFYEETALSRLFPAQNVRFVLRST